MKLKNKPKKGFIENMEQDEITCEIRRWINHLDDCALDYEARWGIGRLPQCVAVDVQVKWETQREKLQNAINTRNIKLIAELVNGTIRGYAKLEELALADGHKPAKPDFLAVQHEESGQVYHITTNNENASRASQNGVKVYTLKEVVNILHAQDNINAIKDVFPKAKVTGVEWNGEEDEIPF